MAVAHQSSIDILIYEHFILTVLTFSDFISK